MSTRLALDNCSLAWLDEHLSDAEKGDLANAFQSHRWNLYVTDELLSEFVPIANDPDLSAVAKRRAVFLLSLMKNRVFRYYGDIMQSEFAASNQLFADCGDVDGMKDFLRDVGNAEPPVWVADFSRQLAEKKERSLVFRREFKASIHSHPANKHLLKTSFPTFEPYHEHLREESRQKLADLFLGMEKNGLARDRLNRSKELMDQMPYFSNYIRVTLARMYWNWVKDRTVKDSDEYDDAQLFYMVGLDLFVTDDQPLADLFRLVHPSDGKKTLTANALAKLILR